MSAKKMTQKEKLEYALKALDAIVAFDGHKHFTPEAMTPLNVYALEASERIRLAYDALWTIKNR